MKSALFICTLALQSPFVVADQGNASACEGKYGRFICFQFTVCSLAAWNRCPERKLSACSVNFNSAFSEGLVKLILDGICDCFNRCLILLLTSLICCSRRIYCSSCFLQILRTWHLHSCRRSVIRKAQRLSCNILVKVNLLDNVLFFDLSCNLCRIAGYLSVIYDFTFFFVAFFFLP